MQIKAPYKKMAILYVVLLHVVIAILLAGTNLDYLLSKAVGGGPHTEFPAKVYKKLFENTIAFNQAVNPEVILLGDSLSLEIPESVLPENTINLSVPGVTTKGVQQFMEVLALGNHGGTFIVELGVNDLKYRTPAAVAKDIQALVRALPKATKVVLVGLLPVDINNSKVQEKYYLDNAVFRRVNEQLSAFCDALIYCTFLDTQLFMDSGGNLHKAYAHSDGWHLSSEGIVALGEAMALALRKQP